ncbi:MAG: M50 family metallopeptidase [Cellulosilyticaceae bacterium]
MKRQEKKGKNNSIIIIIIAMIIGAGFGFFSEGALENTSLGEKNSVFILVLMILFIYTTVYIQIVVHELGHMIAGKMSGYKFVSFRIGRLMLMKEKGKLKLKRFMIVGTGGQCLMMPPIEDRYNYPYILYNLGGGIANLIISFMSAILYLLMPAKGWGTTFLFMLCCIGIFSAFVNMIPMRIGGIANDGYNAKALTKSQETRHAFWVQLYINGVLTAGEKIDSIPNEYFEFPQNPDLNDALICAIGACRCSYLHSKKEFEQAEVLSNYLLENATGLLEIHKNELRCELMFYEIIGLCRKEEIDKFYTKGLQKYIKATKSYITRRRLMYAYELIVENNQQAAQKHLIAFEKAAKNYPYASEVESERDLLTLIKNLKNDKQCEDNAAHS